MPPKSNSNKEAPVQKKSKKDTGKTWLAKGDTENRDKHDTIDVQTVEIEYETTVLQVIFTSHHQIVGKTKHSTGL